VTRRAAAQTWVGSALLGHTIRRSLDRRSSGDWTTFLKLEAEWKKSKGYTERSCRRRRGGRQPPTPAHGFRGPRSLRPGRNGTFFFFPLDLDALTGFSPVSLSGRKPPAADHGMLLFSVAVGLHCFWRDKGRQFRPGAFYMFEPMLR